MLTKKFNVVSDAQLEHVINKLRIAVFIYSIKNLLKSVHDDMDNEQMLLVKHIEGDIIRRQGSVKKCSNSGQNVLKMINQFKLNNNGSMK